ncbi:hypothetical protein [Microcoleus sp. D2_18a_B4]|uniref:hypothetical protein n=1 Tax=Microcoleus sp. D2_18a_B4 TaxID=3055329 RepID=UPI002FD6D7C1
MKILHGTWIPQTEESFVQGGTFCLWVETTQKKKQPAKVHPRQLETAQLREFLTKEAGIQLSAVSNTSAMGREYAIVPRYFLLPTADNQPLPSLELARYLESSTNP